MSADIKPKWEMKPLGDCLLFMSRGVAPSYVSDSPIAALNQKAIRWGYIEKNYLKYHDPAKRVKQDIFISQGDIVVNSTGDITIGRAYYFNKPWPNLFADSHVTILRLNSNILLPEFCIYLFPLPEYQSKIYGLVTGATGQLELSKSNLPKLEVIVPPLSTQRKIAAILSAYDDLIENNLRRIKILDEMAQNLYREWFVKFRFPGHRHARFTDSPLGQIPEGWEMTTLGAVSNVIPGYAFKSKDWADAGIPVIKIKNIRPGNLIDTEQVDHVPEGILCSTHKKYWLYNGDILIAMTGATAGKVGKLRSKNPMLLNQRVAKIEPKQHFREFLWCTVSSPGAEERFYALADGAAQPNMSGGQIENSELLVPSTNLVQQFNDFVSPFVNDVDNMILRNQALCRTRDLLLPRLISGEVDVSELDITVPEEVAA